ncbi:MAG: aminotransferase class I/II-fold pyridoxal phosphate-dependent enzyme [Thermodesulfobacteriota bacterium]
MSLKALEKVLNQGINDLKKRGTFKGRETLITGIKPAEYGKGPRYYIEGQGDKEFLKMNGNSYLGLSLHQEVIEAEEEGARKFGAGPGAVRFISGTYQPHAELEKRLAAFHGREAAMIFSSAYSTIMGIVVPLISNDTIVISDELNHNCIINAIRLSRPADKAVYKHLNMIELETMLKNNVGKGKRAVVLTDGIFSMRGDYAPLHRIVDICKTYDSKYEEGVITVVDDSHGVGAFGNTGRGVEEYTNSKADILVSTLGKALGVNGGYVVSNSIIISYLRETAPFYIYSNPITASEASASMKALEILDSERGVKLLKHMRSLTNRLEEGLQELGFEILSSEHPVVPLMIRDTQKTTELVTYLFANGILATGLNYPVVPKGDEEIRFQIAANHTENDIDYVLGVLKKYNESP